MNIETIEQEAPQPHPLSLSRGGTEDIVALAKFLPAVGIREDLLAQRLAQDALFEPLAT